jgi:hypothetical protein
MPIDINLLRAEKGGDPEYWRGVLRKRFMDVALVDRVIDLDQVSCGPANQEGPAFGTQALGACTLHSAAPL